MPSFVGGNKPKKFSFDKERIKNDSQFGQIHSMVAGLKWAEEHDPLYQKWEGKFWKKELAQEMDKAGIIP